MRKLLLSLVCGVSAMVAQSTNYPTALDTNSTLFVTSDNVQTVLTNPVLVGDTALVVQSNTGFAANQIATVCDTINTSNVCTAWEHMLVTSVSGGNVIFVTRAFANTAAAPHQAGKTVAVLIDSAHQSVLKQAVIAIESALGANLANIPGTASGAAVPINKGGTGATTQSAALAALLATSVVPVANGGTGVAAVQGNGTKAQLSSGSTITNDCVKYDANGNTVDSGAACNALPAATAQLQYLGIAPNSGNLTTYRFAALPVVSAADYLYAAQTPGGTLTGAVGASVTLTPCPLGVNGTDTRLRFYISGGTGTAESVASTGAGTCTSGLATGTVTFTPANNHSGAWTIQSSHAGVYEAIAANPYREIHLPAGIYTFHDCMAVDPNQSLILTGDGYDPAGVKGTILAFAAITSASGCANSSAISESINVGWPINPVTIRGMLIVGGGATTPLINGISFTNVTTVSLDNVMVTGFAGTCIALTNSFQVYISNRTYAQLCGHWGADIEGTANLVSITDSSFAFNSRSTGFGNVAIVGNASPNQSAAVYLKGLVSQAAGTQPFTSVTTAYGLYTSNTSSLTNIGGYFEGNLGGSPNVQVVYAAGTTSLVEIGNLFSLAGTTAAAAAYDVTVKAFVAFGNTFYGQTETRIFNGTDLSTYVVGPDTCIGSPISTECATHAHLMGSVSAISSTGAFTAAVAANYIATESGANNAIAGALLDQSGSAVPLAAGLRVQVKLAHTLQAGANTFVLNGTSKSITSHRSTGNIAAAYAVGAVVELLYDGTQWEDVSQ